MKENNEQLLSRNDIHTVKALEMTEKLAEASKLTIA